ncbi:MAG: DEAD/DEAH box helicase, partial [Planctomycetota bacterium]|nr:DEAD/DEAH box helicase [Planctomycetota bacterium]
MENLGIAEVLGPGGIVAENLPGYEHRSAQLEMAHAVQGAFETGRPLLVEAGTGIGKSFAYLVPAILQAVRQRERVIISTHTISLQEQLVTRDIPFLRRVLPFDFKAALIKGRSNFVCLRR